METNGFSTQKLQKKMDMAGRRREEECLVWEDITVQLTSSSEPSAARRRLLDGVNGYAQPGRILALMGPSGSGKTTLLDSLAGRLPSSVGMAGKVSINGMNLHPRDISYVQQEDIFIGTLTVRETLLYSAHLRLPPRKTNQEIDHLVDAIIEDMGLQDCAHIRIGNWHLRGISGGEKKRLSIGLALITQPYVFLLDEPTSGLDSAAAFFVTQALKNVVDEGRIVAFSVHQPSSEVFELFDDLFLISGGEVIFFGRGKVGRQEAGFPCPIRRSPCEHFLRCINSDFDTVTDSLAITSTNQHGVPSEISTCDSMKTAKTRSILIEKYKQSAYSTKEWMNTTAIPFHEGPRIESHVEKPSKRKQLFTLTRRSFTNMYRDMGYYWLRMAFYISISICIGTLYFNLGTDCGSLISRQACDKFIYSIMIWLSCGGVPFFTEEVKIFYHERSNGHYSEAMFALSHFISSFPFVAATSWISATILYFMLKFKEGASYYLFLVANLYGGIAVMESCMMSATVVVPHMMMAIVVGVAFSGIMMMSSSFLGPIDDIPKFFWRYPMSYISFASWAMEGQFKNDLLGVEFDPLVPGDPKLTGETVVRGLVGDHINHSKWWDMTIAIFLSLCYRVVFYLLVKFKGKRTTFATPTIFGRGRKGGTRKLAKIMRDQTIFSKRHQPPHSLSSQEGLGSPMP